MLKKLSSSPVLVSILMIVFGVVLVVWPSPVLSVVISVLGIGLILGGLIVAIGWMRNKEKTMAGYTKFGGGIAAIVVGLIIFTQPLKVASLFPIMMGIVILVTGLISLVQAWDLKKTGYSAWAGPFVLAMITAICGIVFITQPISALAIPVIAAGIVLIYDGIVSLWIALKRSK